MDDQIQSTGSNELLSRRFRRVRKVSTLAFIYILLAVGAVFSLIPLAWMVSTSLKPQWQVSSQPIIWIPQKWSQIEAGHTGRMFYIWLVKKDQKTVQVVKIGSSNYTTVVGLEHLHTLYSIPEDQVGSPRSTMVGGYVLSVRTANVAGKTRQVVALARDGTDLIVADLDDLHDFAFVSRPALYQSAKKNVVISGISLQVNIVNVNGINQPVIPSGGEKTFDTVLPLQALSNAQMVRSELLQPQGNKLVGGQQMDVYTLAGDQSAMQFIGLENETCNPVLPSDVIQHAFAVNSGDLIGNPAFHSFDNVELEEQPVRGRTQEAVILQKGSGVTLVVEPQFLHDVQMACSGQLSGLRHESILGVQVSIEDDYAGMNNRISQVAVIEESRLMATVIPVDASSTAFSVPDDTTKKATTIGLLWENYVAALSTKIGNANYLTFFRNTAVLAVLNIAGSLLSCTVVAYGFARLRAPGKSVLFIILLATLMLPFPVTMIPLYEIFVRLGALTERLGFFRIGQDTLWPLFLPAFFGDPFIIFLMRQFFMTIPVELEEAARIDGASRFQVLWYILIPLIKPALATAAIFNFMWTWNDFLGPLIFLDSPRNFTISLALNFFNGQYGTNYPLLMAASLVALLPMILLFFFAQRFFIEGITMTGLKG
jgi:multiple sugar transport system permease protein